MARIPAEARTAMGLRAGKLTALEVPDPLRSLPGSHKAYSTASGCTVFCSREPAYRAPSNIWLPPGETMLWHLSIAHKRRYPTWDEIADVRYELCPKDICMAMLLPPPEDYVNYNDYCFHLWQIEDRRLD